MKIKYDCGQMTETGIYAPKEGKKEETGEFYHTLQKLIDRNHEILLTGDMNARVEKVPISSTVGVFGEDIKNDNGDILREFAALSELKIINTFLHKKDIYKHSQSARGLPSLIDYVIMSKTLGKQATVTRIYRGYDVGSYLKWKKQ